MSSIMIRPPAVAGTFYPANPLELQTMVRAFLQATTIPTPVVPKALIVPHAGYIYSGAIAASAYAYWQTLTQGINRIILLGPSHRYPLRGIALTNAQAYATPLGNVPLTQSMHDSLLRLPYVSVLEQAHIAEHSLEVHLPFLQTLFHDFCLIPLVVGEASPQQVGHVLNLLWGDEKTLIVISSDLSHYHPYAIAQAMDTKTSQAIEQLKFDALHYEDACGRNPITGLLYVAKQRGLNVKMVDLRNSGDTAGTKERVVGYGAYIVH
ncbi:AmmeMemoRadiSam system protein B [Beggiatoa leptomitoformis]|uniref:MEMO1 family protein BLE401_05290 n=1 Tax=Beggiatoa leptomitoformis TaxID=288004 RepID=A0A2N9YCI2_9GAMM|nr:AmmeMemoRadiSam system protein B [Beggiatoa leptomitoformis]ALG66534.1 AmmeMemoRadiSam system protein B [Beggiatoa leptomitoformis]AUI68170.1 AmmeMemoRadiSam system protein B [Beggiatoa leptomitoformis]